MLIISPPNPQPPLPLSRQTRHPQPLQILFLPKEQRRRQILLSWQRVDIRKPKPVFLKEVLPHQKESGRFFGTDCFY